MRPFTRLTAVAAPLDVPDVDTDRIVPARFLREPKGAGYGQVLFHDVRFDAEGRERPDFVLNQPPYRRAQILVAADNFGCGSPREMAVWALAGWGFRCLIAPSFGDNFFDNCARNGVLAVVLDGPTCAALRRQLHQGPGGTMTVDLEEQSVAAANGTLHRFTIDAVRKQALLTGQDESALTLADDKEIAAVEAHGAGEAPLPPP